MTAAMQPNRVPVASLIDAMRGGKYPFWYPVEAYGYAIEYFVFAIDFLGLVGGGQASQPINIPGDAAFCVLSGVAVQTDTTNVIFFGNHPFTANIFDSGSGRTLSNVPLRGNNWFGTAEEPKYWDVPRILSPNSTVNTTLVNLDTVNTYNISIAYHGFKMYGFSPTVPRG